MAPRQRAHIKPELLEWARKQSGLTLEVAAKKLHVTPERLRAWEDGGDEPTIKQLRTAGRVYHLALAVFYLQSPPWQYQPIPDFRRFPADGVAPLSPELMLEIRRAYDRRDVALELISTADEPPADFALQASLTDDPEQLAPRMRECLGADLQEQRRWRGPGTAFKEWRGLVERAGVLVFQTAGIEPAEMRGFSIGDSPMPAVVVNRADASAARVFTLLHELTHIALHTAGLCNLSEIGPQSAEARRLEAFCNHVAGAVLVPREALLAHSVVSGHAPSNWRPQELEPLAREFGVSRQVVIRRLLMLHRTDQHNYEGVMRALDEEFRRRPKPEKGFLAPADNALSLAGRLYTRLALSAFHQNRITASTLSDFLGLRLKHVATLEQSVAI